MSKAVLISIQPEWCELIASGAKTVEVRKTKPKLEPPFKCYIYCTLPKKSGDIYLVGDVSPVQGNGKVIGEFVCNRISPIAATCDGLVDVVDLQESCMTVKEMFTYSGGKLPLYGWHISDLVIYDKPREITNFYEHCDEDYDCWLCKWWGKETATCKMPPITRPPQSWCYVDMQF